MRLHYYYPMYGKCPARHGQCWANIKHFMKGNKITMNIKYRILLPYLYAYTMKICTSFFHRGHGVPHILLSWWLRLPAPFREEEIPKEDVPLYVKELWAVCAEHEGRR